MPNQLIITKENKEKITKNKSQVVNIYKEREIKEYSKKYKSINIISNENYKVTTDNFGNSLSEYKELMVNRYKDTLELNQGINSYIRNMKNKKIIKIEENAKVIFAPDKTKFIKNENNLKYEETVFLDPNKDIEIRRLEIFNLGNQEEILEVIIDFEPSLSNKMQDYAHPAFNKLFVKFTEDKDNIIFEKRDREGLRNCYLATTLYTESEQVVKFEYEINRENYIGRENYGIPVMVREQKNFSSWDS